MAKKIAATSRAFGALLFTFIIACGNLDPPGSQLGGPGVGDAIRIPQALDVTIVPYANHPMLDHQGFGRSVALSGSRVAVADCTYCTSPKPHVDTFALLNGVPTFTGMVPEDGLASPWFGYRVAMKNGLIAVSERDDRPYDFGRVRMFKWDGARFAEESPLLYPEYSSVYPQNASTARFGEALAMSADRLVVGSPSESRQLSDGTWTHETGAAFVYQRTVAGWTLEATLLAETANPHEFFGAAVAIAGPLVAVVESSTAGSQPEDYGTVHLFKRVTDGVYVRDGTLTIGEERPYRVAICGGDVVVAGEWSEGVHVFRRCRAGWRDTGHVEPVDPTQIWPYPRELACDATTLAVGLPFVGPAEMEWVGETRIYKASRAGWSLVRVVNGNEVDEWSGTGIDVDAGVVAIGAPNAGVNGVDTGTVRLLRP